MENNINELALTENYLDEQDELFEQYKKDTGNSRILFTTASLKRYVIWLEEKLIRINQLKKGGLIVMVTYKFPNGMVCTCDMQGDQVPELQGKYSPELHKKIKYYSNEKTEWNGF